MYSFSITDKEQLKIKALLAVHDEKCKYAKSRSAIGGRLSYVFTPTTIGTIAFIKCSCGEKIEFQDPWDDF